MAQSWRKVKVESASKKSGDGGQSGWTVEVTVTHLESEVVVSRKQTPEAAGDAKDIKDTTSKMISLSGALSASVIREDLTRSLLNPSSFSCSGFKHGSRWESKAVQSFQRENEEPSGKIKGKGKMPVQEFCQAPTHEIGDLHVKELHPNPREIHGFAVYPGYTTKSKSEVNTDVSTKRKLLQAEEPEPVQQEVILK
ncbi:hypothetical protein WISP_101044 [Willisornis vidua]|uniref:Uncharacterized protein n=1 Tax=Willisornis vidua TaxID=1566151 RepID=A0ABQ9D3H4_9PASS|nr:hypothetical protein WISP_101044 [Willisornis vidua]